MAYNVTECSGKQVINPHYICVVVSLHLRFIVETVNDANLFQVIVLSFHYYCSVERSFLRGVNGFILGKTCLFGVKISAFIGPER
jgi:hypothetical protein